MAKSLDSKIYEKSGKDLDVAGKAYLDLSLKYNSNKKYDSNKKSLKSKLKSGVAVLGTIGVLALSCAGCAGDPLYDAVAGSLPEILQPGDYRQMQRAIEEERRKNNIWITREIIDPETGKRVSSMTGAPWLDYQERIQEYKDFLHLKSNKKYILNLYKSDSSYYKGEKIDSMEIFIH